MNPYAQPYLAQTETGGGAIPMLMMFVIGIVVYLVVTFPIYKIAERLNQENAWMAWVPIVNLFLIASMAGKEWWWVLLLLIPIIGFVIAIILWMGVAENLGHPSWMGILMIVPILNLALLYYWAFGQAPATRN
jgi:hypothetical protein